MRDRTHRHRLTDVLAFQGTPVQVGEQLGGHPPAGATMSNFNCLREPEHPSVDSQGDLAQSSKLR